MSLVAAAMLLASVTLARGGELMEGQSLEGKPPVPTRWKVEVDPAEALKLPEELSLRLPRDSRVIAPVVSERALLITRSTGKSPVFYDLATGRPNRLGGHVETDLATVSPDGTLIAAHTSSYPEDVVSVGSLKEKKLLAKFEFPDDRPEWLALHQDMLIVRFNVVGGNDLFRAFDIKTQNERWRRQLQAGMENNSFTVSPGFGYMAVAEHEIGSRKHEINVYDLSDGRLAGQIALQGDPLQSLDVRGLAFTPDGQTLLAVVSVAATDYYLYEWDVKKALPQVKTLLDFGDNGRRWPSSNRHTARKLEVLGDDYIVLYGRYVFNRKSGKLMRELLHRVPGEQLALARGSQSISARTRVGRQEKPGHPSPTRLGGDGRGESQAHLRLASARRPCPCRSRLTFRRWPGGACAFNSPTRPRAGRSSLTQPRKPCEISGPGT